jgi:hypothetical protein
MKSSDWIKTKVKLPDLKVMNNFEKESDEVLLCLCGKEIIIGKLKETNVGKLIVSNHNTQMYWKSSIGEYSYPFNYVTHWQPIVIPKKEDI